MLSPTHSEGSEQLVIDEPPMEIESDHSDGYFDNVPPKSVPYIVDIYENVQSKSLPPPVKEIVPNRTEIPVAVVAPSTPNNEKSAVAKPKRVAHTHCFKMSNLMEAESNRLCISALCPQFYEMRIFLMPNSLLAAETTRITETSSETSNISIAQLLNWPDVRVTINFRDLTLSRMTRGNLEHDLVFGDDTAIDLDTKPNVLETRQCNAIVSSKQNPLAYTPILLTYFSAIIDAAAMTEMSRARQNEIEQIYVAFKKDLEKINVVETKKDHSQFLAPFKYMRLFDNDTNYVKAKSHGPKVQLRETINPEVVFSVDKCKFDIDRLDHWENDVLKYLENLFTKQDKFCLEVFKEMLKKSVMVSCTICNKTFEGILCMVSIKGHLRDHYNKTDWACVRCKKSFSTFQLTGANNWSHNCSPNSGMSS